MKIKQLYALLLLVTLSSSAYAYLDPGSGSIILQALIGGVAASTVVISAYYKKIKQKIRTIFKRHDTKNQKNPTTEQHMNDVK